MSFLDDIARPIVADALATYGTTVTIKKITRSLDRATLRETQSATVQVTLPCTRREFTLREQGESGGKILGGDLRVSISSEAWEAATIGGVPLPRKVSTDELLFEVVEGDGSTAADYRAQGVEYGVAQALTAVYHWQLRRV